MANLILGTPGADFIAGTPDDDIIFGDSGNDSIFAGMTDGVPHDSDDFMIGGDGDDVIGGGPGDDILIGNAHIGSNDLTFGSAQDTGSNILFGGPGNNLIITGTYSNPGVDVSFADAADGALLPFISGAGDNIAWAGPGNDTVYSGGGDDEIGGGSGDAEIYITGGNNIVYGGAGFGNNIVETGDGNDTIYGGGAGGSNAITTSGGDNLIFGGKGDTTITSGDGADSIFAGAGDNVVSGGGGGDTFGFGVGNLGNTTITDFTLGEDILGLQNFSDDFANAEAVINAMADTSNGVVLTIASGQTVTFEGLTVQGFTDTADPWVNLTGTPEGSPEGDTLTLTEGTDDLQGTDNNDLFNAPLVSIQDGGGITEVQTLNNTDQLDGGAGTDRLNATLNNTGVLPGSNDGEIAPTITNIEQIYFRAIDSSGVNFSNVKGVEELWNDRSLADASIWVTDIQEAVTFGITGTRALTRFDYDDDAAIDTTQEILLEDAGTADTAFLFSSSTLAAETINIVATGTNDVGFFGSRLVTVEDLNLSGDGTLMLRAQATFSRIETVDATAYAGDLTLDISGQPSRDKLESVETGDGDNTVAVHRFQFVADNDLILDLGAGNNTLIIPGASKSTSLNNLSFEGDDLSIEGVTTLAFTSAVELSAETTLDFDGISPDAVVFEAVTPETGLQTLILSGFKGEEITFAEESNTRLIADDAEGPITISAPNGFVGNMSLAKATSLSITGENSLISTGAGGLTAENITDLTIDTGESGEVGIQQLIADELTTVTVSGAADLGIRFHASTSNLETVDLSDLTGAATLLAEQSEFDGVVTIEVGEGDLAVSLQTDGNAAGREIFEFVAGDIGNIFIAGFEAGAFANDDRLDLSAFGINNANASDELSIDNSGDHVVLTSDAFGGEITLLNLGSGDANVATSDILASIA